MQEILSIRSLTAQWMAWVGLHKQRHLINELVHK